MRIEYEELMEKLGTGYELSPYETRPWFLHDKESGIMCSAEVRAGPGLYDIEAEIQFLHDDSKPPEPEPEEEEKPLPIIKYEVGGEDIYETNDDDDEEDEKDKKPKKGPRLGKDGPEQVFHTRFLPNKDQLWQGNFLQVRGEEYKSKLSNWDERGCAFFQDFVAALQMNELADVDELIEEHLVDRYRGGRGRRGRIGKKGFKVEQKGMTMGMKG